MSAKTLERTLGTKYRVAWTMLHRFRVSMVDAERKQLSGNVEVDETFVGGVKQGGKRGRGAVKNIVVIAMKSRNLQALGVYECVTYPMLPVLVWCRLCVM